MESFLNTMRGLDSLICQYESKLGLPHKKSPFERTLQANGIVIKKTKGLIVPQRPQKASDENINSEHKIKVKKALTGSPENSKISSSKSSVQNFDGKKKGFSKPSKQGKGQDDQVKVIGEMKVAVLEAGSDEKAFDDFRRCDLRVGEFTKVWKHPESDYLYCEEINIKREIRQIASGLQGDVPIESMSGKIIVFSNLKVKKLGGFPSNGMLLCSNLNLKEFELLRPLESSEAGERVYLDGKEAEYPDEPEKQLQSKVLDRVLNHFKTDSEGYPVYMGVRLRTKAGYLKPSKNKNGNVD